MHLSLSTKNVELLAARPAEDMVNELAGSRGLEWLAWAVAASVLYGALSDPAVQSVDYQRPGWKSVYRVARCD